MNPVCEICEIEGKTRETQEVHHWNPFIKNDKIIESLAMDMDNLVCLCSYHHHALHEGPLKGCVSLTDVKERLKYLKERETDDL